MRYAVDTDVAIDYLRGRKEAVERLDGLMEHSVTQVTSAELFYGAYRSAKPAERAEEVGGFLDAFEVIDVDRHVCRMFGALKALMRGEGTERSDFDLLVAASCIVNDRVLITGNLGHYRGIPKLRVESV
ncbi:MAG: type II toxin-antitoxin system VapC family toxin [Candidatus Altiarchaeota archaeon]|nr:type II toxin-antitoxin system VapC family toxin [Candidatus Altiarchaeota archaeon]